MLAERGRLIGPGRVPGRLYDFGRYPGARPAIQPEQWIIGEIFHLSEPRPILVVLDEYEGPEFERAMIAANGTDCWIYWYVGPDPGHPIPSGDWFQR